MHKAFKYKIEPSKAQKKKIIKFFGCARFIYNWGLATKIKAYEDENRYVSEGELSGQIKFLKRQKEYDWLKKCANVCLQQSLKNLETAYKNFFGQKKGFPKFKSRKHSRQSIKFTEHVHFDFNKWKVKVPKIGWIRLCPNREIDLSKWTLWNTDSYKRCMW